MVIVVPFFQIANSILEYAILDPTAISLVWYLTRGNGSETCVDSNGLYSHSKLLYLIYTIYWDLNTLKELLPVAPSQIWSSWHALVASIPVNFSTYISKRSLQFSLMPTGKASLFVKRNQVVIHKCMIGCPGWIIIGYPLNEYFNTNTKFFLPFPYFKSTPPVELPSQYHWGSNSPKVFVRPIKPHP